MNEPLLLCPLVGRNERGKKEQEFRKKKEKPPSGVLGLLLCASFPGGIIVVLLGLA